MEPGQGLLIWRLMARPLANTDVKYTDLIYSEHALEIGSSSRAMAYIGIKSADGKITWGAGMDTDIITASVLALFSAINRMKAGK